MLFLVATFSLRFLFYIAREYEKIVDDKNIYKSNLIKIPTPEFIVLYNGKNGKNEYPKSNKLYLSDAFCYKDNLKLEKANSLNSNLLRISRERANQERNLRPKKSHNGFVILNRQSIPYKFYFNSNSKNKKTNFIEFECFKTKIQTPFNSSINLDLIKDDIINSFKNIMNEFNIDIWYNYYSINNTFLSNLEEIFYSSKNNFIFKHCFVANYKSNFWELEIHIKKDIVKNLLKTIK